MSFTYDVKQEIAGADLDERQRGIRGAAAGREIYRGSRAVWSRSVMAPWNRGVEWPWRVSRPAAARRGSSWPDMKRSMNVLDV